jgi:adenine deaminase
VEGDDALLSLVSEAQSLGKHICGHGSEVRGRRANAWVAYVGETDDHECVTADEAVEKAQLGVWISMRQGSGCYNIPAVADAVTQHGVDPRRFTLCTDLVSPMELAANGHIDHCVRVAVRSGIDPVTAIQMATLNAAECMGIAGLVGSITPGRVADILLVGDLSGFAVDAVIAGGHVVARGGELTGTLDAEPYPSWSRDTVTLAGLRQEAFDVRAPSASGVVTVRAIGASGVSLITEEQTVRLNVRDGCVHADPARDILKIASIERFSGRAELGVGFVCGFGLRRGAIAGSYNPQHQDVIVVGADSRDMFVAAKALEQMGGGFAVAVGGELRASLPLPLFGLLADRSLKDVVGGLSELYAALRDLGCELPAPFHTLAFVGLPVDIGTLKISPKGVVDVWKGEVVPVVI